MKQGDRVRVTKLDWLETQPAPGKPGPFGWEDRWLRATVTETPRTPDPSEDANYVLVKVLLDDGRDFCTWAKWAVLLTPGELGS